MSKPYVQTVQYLEYRVWHTYIDPQVQGSEFTNFQKEFGVHIWWFCSTHEYFDFTKFQLQTPPTNIRTRT